MGISSSPAEVSRTVAVIGSARLSPPDPRCLPAEQIGAAVAAQGWTVMTGGYGGLMEVASRAAAGRPGRGSAGATNDRPGRSPRRMTARVAATPAGP